jgi:isopentenyl phosphate kinase
MPCSFLRQPVGLYIGWEDMTVCNYTTLNILLYNDFVPVLYGRVVRQTTE